MHKASYEEKSSFTSLNLDLVNSRAKMAIRKSSDTIKLGMPS